MDKNWTIKVQLMCCIWGMNSNLIQRSLTAANPDNLFISQTHFSALHPSHFEDMVVISAQKCYISYVSLGILVTCSTSYLWKSSNCMHLFHLCFICLTLPFMCRKIQARTKNQPKSKSQLAISEFHA